MWQEVIKEVSQTRAKLPADSLNAYADRYTALTDAGNYKKMHLVDELVYADGARQMLRNYMKGNDFKLVSVSDLSKNYKPSTSDNKIAVYYAEGNIVDEVMQNAMNRERQIVGSKVVSDLDELANDEDVKAVVLRINSGGGSAYASEQMWRAIQLLKAKKPVVVSMGGMAASGGYYMSCGANYVYAQPTTLTGSIGIFGMIPDASGLLTEKLGLHFDVVKTNKSSDFGAMGRAFNLDEAAAMQAYVERGYDLFLSRVAAGRKLSKAQVDKIGQGRVWTGSQALTHKLVDAIGGLDQAVAKAAQLANLKANDYELISTPASQAFFERLMQEKMGDDYMERELKNILGDYYEPLNFLRNANKRSMLQARMFYLPNIK